MDFSTTLSSETESQNKLRKGNTKQKHTHRCWDAEADFHCFEWSHSGFSRPLNSDNIRHSNGECLNSHRSEE